MDEFEYTEKCKFMGKELRDSRFLARPAADGRLMQFSNFSVRIH